MGLVFCTPVLVSLWGHLKYWHKTETPASLFWLASCQHQLAHALQKGKQDCLRASKPWRSQQRQRFVHTHNSTLQLLSTVVADIPRELQDLVVLSLAPLSPRIQFLGRACISRCTMHFSNHPLLLAGFFFFSKIHFGVWKHVFKNSSHMMGDPFHGKVKVLVTYVMSDCSLPGSSVHGILQARILEWVAIPFSRGSSWLRDQTWVSCIGGESLYHLSHQGSVFLFLCLFSIQKFNNISVFSILVSQGIKHLLHAIGIQEAILASIRVSAFLMEIH